MGPGRVTKTVNQYLVHILPPVTDNKSKEGKDQESIQSSTTPDPRRHMGK